MPWLLKKEGEYGDENLFFVHVPRCGGTSLMKSHHVPEKAMIGRSLWGKLGLWTFFHRYAAFEKANFPIWSNGNAGCAIIILVALSLLAVDDVKYRTVSSWLIAVATCFFFGLTFFFTAPTIARFTSCRRMYLVLNHHVLCRFMESLTYITGTNKLGYLNHLTAKKLLENNYCTDQEIKDYTLAIVRNPYSRMVSIYMYNRFGPLESFDHFVRSWYNKTSKHYRETGDTSEWSTPCHVFPMYEYTHVDGKKVVRSVVKQEELKLLKDLSSSEAQESSVANLPKVAEDALLGMPHDNKRKTTKPWWSYYTQETLEMTYKLYAEDFDTFDYSPILEQRPDLRSPVDSLDRQSRKSKKMLRRQESL